MERAAAYLALNRASWCGMAFQATSKTDGSVSIKGIANILNNFYSPNLSVDESDYTDWLESHPDMFCYLDPPYVKAGADFYGHQKGVKFDHHKLAEILKGRKGWVLSYDNHKLVHELYKDYQIETPSWRYQMGEHKEGTEVLVINV